MSIFYTTTIDLDTINPSDAAREMGYTNVPLMCASELNIKDSLKKCIRIMMHINSNKNLDEITHIYLNNAKKLRPDLANKQNE